MQKSVLCSNLNKQEDNFYHVKKWRKHLTGFLRFFLTFYFENIYSFGLAFSFTVFLRERYDASRCAECASLYD